MEIKGFALLIVFVSSTCLVMAQTSSNETQTGNPLSTTSNRNDEMTSSSVDSMSSGAFNVTRTVNMTTTMSPSSRTFNSTPTIQEGQPVLIGNSSPPTVLQVDTSQPSVPPNQTNQSDSSSTVTSWTTSESPSSTTTGGAKEAGSSLPPAEGVTWEVKTSDHDNSGKSKYDVQMGDEPPRTDGRMTEKTNGMESGTIGYSKEVSLENKPKSSNSNNGASFATISLLVLMASPALFLLRQ